LFASNVDALEQIMLFIILNSKKYGRDKIILLGEKNGGYDY